MVGGVKGMIKLRNIQAFLVKKEEIYLFYLSKEPQKKKNIYVHKIYLNAHLRSRNVDFFCVLLDKLQP